MAEMAEKPVTITSAADVACCSTTVNSAVLALEISNDFLLGLKRDGKDILVEINKKISGQVVALNANSTRLQQSIEKAVGKLSSRFTQAKGGAERKKIRSRKTRITLSSDDTIKVAALENQIQQTEVNVL